jgi:hypothetical protein
MEAQRLKLFRSLAKLKFKIDYCWICTSANLQDPFSTFQLSEVLPELKDKRKRLARLKRFAVFIDLENSAIEKHQRTIIGIKIQQSQCFSDPKTVC